MKNTPFDLREYLTQNLAKSAAVRCPKGYIESLDTSKLQFDAGDFKYGNVSETTSAIVYIDSITNENDTSVPATDTEHRSYHRTASVGWTVTKAIKHAVDVQLRIGPPKGLINISAAYSFELSTSNTNEQTDSVDQGWSVDFPVEAPPHTKVVMEVFMKNVCFEAPFTFKGELRGSISFIVFSEPGEATISYDCGGDIKEFIPGMPQVPELSMVDGKLLFNGGGLFNGIAGSAVETKRKEYPLKKLTKLRV